ncbi:MAG: carboxypeptidase regulatory-like domain-containing protein [Fimbriimonadaceae bacterium]|nr:carboxypeptidase regulatory-like domain-containing protein [Chitinophagales bacterium]
MTNKKQNYVAFITGCIFLLIVLAVVLWKETPSPTTFFVIRVLLALAAGAFATILPGFLKIENTLIKAGGPIAIAVGIYLWNPPVINTDDKLSDLKGTVLIDNNATERVSVTVLGTTVYTDNSGNFVISDKQIDTTQTPTLNFVFKYNPNKPDDRNKPKYKLIDETIFVRTSDAIKINNMFNLEKIPADIPEIIIEGYVKDKYEKPLGGVEISVNEIDKTTTNNAGFFSMKIKTTEERVPVTFEKTGYQSETIRTAVPNKNVSVELRK